MEGELPAVPQIELVHTESRVSSPRRARAVDGWRHRAEDARVTRARGFDRDEMACRIEVEHVDVAIGVAERNASIGHPRDPNPTRLDVDRHRRAAPVLTSMTRPRPLSVTAPSRSPSSQTTSSSSGSSVSSGRSSMGSQTAATKPGGSTGAPLATRSRRPSGLYSAKSYPSAIVRVIGPPPSICQRPMIGDCRAKATR